MVLLHFRSLEARDIQDEYEVIFGVVCANRGEVPITCGIVSLVMPCAIHAICNTCHVFVIHAIRDTSHMQNMPYAKHAICDTCHIQNMPCVIHAMCDTCHT
jgi:ferredoxin